MNRSNPACTRRDALLRVGKAGAAAALAVGAGLYLSSRNRRPVQRQAPRLARDLRVPPVADLPELVIARGHDPESLVHAAIDRLGGIRRFITRGDVVVLKPNVSWDRAPEQAANTDPHVVAALARLCLEAGASRVLLADVTIHDARRCFERSQIGPLATRAGASIVWPEPSRLREVDFGGEVLRVWPVLDAFLEADKVINLPVAKHHSLTRVTLALKNWYGIIGGPRQRLHQRIEASLADLVAALRPTLTVIDAWRVLLRGGPSGGSLADVRQPQTLIASTDPVAADACAAELFWSLPASELPFLQVASRRGLGSPAWRRLRLAEVQL